MADDVTLAVGGSSITGWTEISITRGLERYPNTFEFSYTERVPDQAAEIVAQPGDACVVSIGPDVVITGWVVTVHSSFDEGAHTVRVIGGGKTMDLVDCSAEWPSGQIAGADALEVARRLARPYGITVIGIGDPGPPIPMFNLTIGETPADVVERLCRYAGLLAYEDEQGQLILGRIGTDKHASGVAQAVNVQAASCDRTFADRYSEIDAFQLSTFTLGDLGNGGAAYARAFDPNVKRNRKLYLVAEGSAVGYDVCKARTQWEASRRMGRGLTVGVTIDSWRDSAGQLWTPNKLAPVDLPLLKVLETELCLGEVTYRKDLDGGTSAQLVLMPPAAFALEPVALQPVIKDLGPPATGTP